VNLVKFYEVQGRINRKKVLEHHQTVERPRIERARQVGGQLFGVKQLTEQCNLVISTKSKM